MIDWAAFTDIPFTICTLALFVAFSTFSVSYAYISYYSINRGFTNRTLGFYIFAIFNTGSLIGRNLPGALSDRIGVFKTAIPSAVEFGVISYALLGVFNTGGMVAGTIFIGFFSGIVAVLPAPGFRMLIENKSMIGSRMGLVCW